MALATAAVIASLLAAGGALDLPMPPPPAPRRPQPPKLARVVLLDLQVTGEVPDRARAAFGQALHAELRKLEAVSLLTAVEIREILSTERQKQLLGCSEEASSCMAELAGALDASEMLSGELTLVARKYTLTLRRANLQRAAVQSKTRTFEQRDGEELLAVVGPLVEELFPDRPLLPGRKRGVSAEVVRRLNPPPLPKWLLFATTGAGAAAGLAGGALGLLSLQAEAQHLTLAERSLEAPVPGADLAALRQRAEGQALLANGLFVAAGAMALGAALEIAFTDWDDAGGPPTPAAPRLSLVPTGEGGAAVRLSF